MKTAPITLLMAVLLIGLNGCAALLNQPYDPIKIVTPEPAPIVVNDDTMGAAWTEHIAHMERGKEPVTITVLSDTGTTTVNLKGRNSLAFWLNAIPFYHTIPGLIVDWGNPKRYNYPDVVYIEPGISKKGYLKYVPLADSLETRRQTLKIAPLHLLGTRNPGFELTYERKLNTRLSAEIMGTYLFPETVWRYISGTRSLEVDGFRAGFGLKYFWREPGLLGPYIGMDIQYGRNEYNASDLFFIRYEPEPNLVLNYYESLPVRVNRETLTYSIRAGMQVLDGQRFVVDVFAGLGARYHWINVTAEKPDWPNPETIELTNRSNQHVTPWGAEGNPAITFHIPFSVRIGYLF